MALKLERNRDKIVQDFFLASQKDVDELHGTIDWLEQQQRQLKQQK